MRIRGIKAEFWDSLSAEEKAKIFDYLTFIVMVIVWLYIIATV